VFDQRTHAPVAVLAIARDFASELHGIGSNALHDLLMQQHVEQAAMHRVLRPFVASQKATRLGINVVAIEADQRPFLGGEADAIEFRARDAEIVELAYGIGLQIDADAERTQVTHCLEDDTGNADLMQRQGRRQPANAAAGDDYAVTRHKQNPSSMGSIILPTAAWASH